MVSNLNGLPARSTNESVAVKWGGALDRQIVWADCQATSSYTPPVEGAENVGPRWLHVLWKVNQSDEGYHTSDPGDPYRAWMYQGYLVPLNHNGAIPNC